MSLSVEIANEFWNSDKDYFNPKKIPGIEALYFSDYSKLLESTWQSLLFIRHRTPEGFEADWVYSSKSLLRYWKTELRMYMGVVEELGAKHGEEIPMLNDHTTRVVAGSSEVNGEKRQGVKIIRSNENETFTLSIVTAGEIPNLRSIAQPEIKGGTKSGESYHLEFDHQREDILENFDRNTFMQKPQGSMSFIQNLSLMHHKT